jgi:hypothetical protein
VRCDYCGADNERESGHEVGALRGSTGDPAARVRAAIGGREPQRVLEEIARRLQAALGKSVVVDAPGAGRSGPSVLEEEAPAPRGAGRVAAIRANVGEHRLELQLLGGRITGRRSKVVRGIAVDPLVVDDRNLATVLAADLQALGEGVLARFLAG